MTDVTLFWSLYNAGLNGDFGAAADMIDGDCGYAMLPTMEGKHSRPLLMGAFWVTAGYWFGGHGCAAGGCRDGGRGRFRG